MALLALQVSGHADALTTRGLLLLCFAFACVPLSALQRLLWRHATPVGPTALWLLAAITVLALASNLPLALRAQALQQAPLVLGWDSLLRGRGLDSLGPALLVQAALHAALNLAWARQAERERALAAESLAREAELLALRYQLQPHFLFNTLNAVSALVAAERGREAQHLISRLADYLRSTLEADPRHLVPLADELAHAADYLAIEQCRLGERLRWRQQIEPGLLGQPTPRGLLQPLLENAVQHGLALRAQGGDLDLRIRRDGDRVELELLNDLPDAPHSDPAARAGLGVGLRNVRARLEALFPQAHTVHAAPLRTAQGTRWQVQVRWPLHA
jgi:two-component system, LytTR family, sensor histidine kinase AlgZ